MRVDERVLRARGVEVPLGARVDALEGLGDLALEVLDAAHVLVALLVVALAGVLDVASDALLEARLLLLEADDRGLEFVCGEWEQLRQSRSKQRRWLLRTPTHSLCGPAS